MDIFENRGNTLPVWFMRQAGRYHSHYQNIKQRSDFMTMCKTPQLACDVTMGPINDFNFEVISPSSTTLQQFHSLIEDISYPFDYYDYYMAATMLENDMKNILTVNTKDFSSIPEIEAVNPFL